MTYTVQSSPSRKPWKRHYYFFQTEHSVATFRKNINRKDETRTEVGKSGTIVHPTLYDVKGIGGGAFVVAAGCSREDGERYTVLVDAPVVPIPDWLVDWVKSDYAKYMSEMSKQRMATHDQAAGVPESVREVLRAQGEPSAFDVAEADIYDFMLSRAGSLASLGVNRKLIKKCLIELVKSFCAGGHAYVKEHVDTIHNVAFSKTLRVGDAKWFKRMGEGKRAVLRARFEQLKANYQTRKTLLVEAMRKFPDQISAEHGYQRLTRALAGTEYKLPENKKVSQHLISEIRKVAGFTTERTSTGWVWVRLGETSPSPVIFNHLSQNLNTIQPLII